MPRRFPSKPCCLFQIQFHVLAGTNAGLRRWPLVHAERAWMGKAEQYRHYAAECIRLAQQTSDPKERDTLLGMAEAWRRLAERDETLRERDGDTKPE